MKVLSVFSVSLLTLLGAMTVAVATDSIEKDTSSQADVGLKECDTFLSNRYLETPGNTVIWEMARQVAPFSYTVLIDGPTGTGKDVLARYIHDHSKRKDKIFIPVNGAAIPDGLAESLLFGHAKGSYTGAVQSSNGIFRDAQGGTVFLDEVADLSLTTQAKLLRVLEQKEVQPVGESKIYPVDVRVIAATNKNLENEVKEGRFRQDLYFRLNTFHIRISPLNERKEDVPLLAQFLLEKHKKQEGLETPKGFTENAMEKLKKNPLNGNVRELDNIVARCFVMAQGQDLIDVEVVIAALGGQGQIPRGMGEKVGLTKEIVDKALDESGGNLSEAAQKLGVAKTTVKYWRDKK